MPKPGRHPKQQFQTKRKKRKKVSKLRWYEDFTYGQGVKKKGRYTGPGHKKMKKTEYTGMEGAMTRKALRKKTWKLVPGYPKRKGRA